MATSGNFVLSNISCLNLCKSKDGINTGVGYLDHMLDQITSHAQIGISIQASKAGEEKNLENRNRYDSLTDQKQLMECIGREVGGHLGKLVKEGVGKTSRFSCPLDEALVECNLKVVPDGEGRLASFTLAPYGIYPNCSGRTKIGCMYTAPLNTFFESLSKAMHVELELVKHRGDNGHHVVESAFKAFSRALRNLLDGLDTATDAASLPPMVQMWGPNSESYQLGIEMQRCASSTRKTKETGIEAEILLDGMQSGIDIDTGIKTLDGLVYQIAHHASVSLKVDCKGDLYVDDHHTSEDVAIAIGQVLNKALGTKAGLNRMWTATATSNDAQVQVVMDLSNRPCLTHNLSLSSSKEEVVGDMSVEMIAHFFESLVMNSHMTLHILQNAASSDTTGLLPIGDLAIATAQAFGKALKMCVAVDPRRAGATASSKGTLSV